MLFEYILKSLPHEPEDAICGIWSDADEILCNTEAKADAIADLLEALGYDCVVTGYYDPIEDERSGETDKYTGWCYVSH